MAGIYIHIPFCKQACYYCDFHFSVSLQKKDAFVQALLKEIGMQRNYFSELQDSVSEKVTIETIYFGGGTPSLLSGEEIKKIFEEIKNNFEVSASAEIPL